MKLHCDLCSAPVSAEIRDGSVDAFLWIECEECVSAQIERSVVMRMAPRLRVVPSDEPEQPPPTAA